MGFLVELQSSFAYYIVPNGIWNHFAEFEIDRTTNYKN